MIAIIDKVWTDHPAGFPRCLAKSIVPSRDVVKRGPLRTFSRFGLWGRAPQLRSEWEVDQRRDDSGVVVEPVQDSDAFPAAHPSLRRSVVKSDIFFDAEDAGHRAFRDGHEALMAARVLLYRRRRWAA